MSGSNPEENTEPEHNLAPAELGNLRWLLSQAGGTIAEVAYRLESRASDVDENARRYLRDDVLVVEDELAMVKALLVDTVDWDAEFRRLLEGE